MSTLRVNTIQDTAGSGSPAINGLAKAWVNFNGTGTVAIRASMNVSSITDLGTGNYDLNFTTSMIDSNYVTLATASDGGWGNKMDLDNSTYNTTSKTRVRSFKGDSLNTQIDIERICVAVFR